MHQPGVRVVQPAGKPERLEARVGVAGDAAPGVVADLLDDSARRRVDHFHRAAQRIADDPIGHPALDHQVRNVGPGAIHEGRHHVALAIQFGNGVNAVGIQEALHQGAVDGLAHPPAQAVVGVGDGLAGRLHLQQVPQRVVLVGRAARAGQAAVRGIAVRHAVVGRQLVIRVVGGHRLAIDADAIAVAIVAVAIDHAAVLTHRGQPTAGIVGVAPGGRGAVEILDVLRDPPVGIAGVARLVERRRAGVGVEGRHRTEAIVGACRGNIAGRCPCDSPVLRISETAPILISSAK